MSITLYFSIKKIPYSINTFRGEKANVTSAFDPKLVRTARLIPRPLVRSGNISDTISQLIGPNDTWKSHHSNCIQKSIVVVILTGYF